MKVLLVEDNPNYALLVEAMLRARGPECLTFSWVDNLAEGMQQIEGGPPDVILLDLSLPDSDGLETLARLQKSAGATPIIVLTGSDDAHVAIEAMRCGAQDYLVKTDIDKPGLLRAIRYAVERRNAERKYRELVESIDAIVWEAEPISWRFTFVSNAAERILGYPTERWLHEADFRVNLIHPEDRPGTVKYCQQQIEVGTGCECEYRAVAQDGRVVWLRDLVRNIKDQAGHPIALRGIMIDITRSKQAEAEQQKHHREIQSLQDIGRIILETVEPNAGVEKALERSIAAGEFDFGDILLATPEGEFVSVAAACGFRDPANLQRRPRPGSAARRMAHLHKPSIEKNIQQGDRLGSLKREGAETALMIPLRSGERSLGLVQLASRKPKDIQPSELALFEAIGRQLGIAIQKASLNQRLETNLKRIRALYETNLAVTSTLDLRAQINILLDNISQIFPDYALTVRLLDRETGELDPLACRNLDETAWKATKPTPRFGGLAEVLRLRETVQIAELETDPRTHFPDFWKRHGFSSYLGVPLVFQRDVLGVMGFYSKTRHEFRDSEVAFLTTLAEQAAIAVHNARLFAEAEKKSQELGALLDVSKAASQSLNLEFILQEVARKIADIFEFDAVRILLLDERKEELSVRARYEKNTDFTLGSMKYKAGQGLAGVVAATGEAILIENIDHDPRYATLTHTKAALRSGQKFIASFPIRYKDHILGATTCVGLKPRRLLDQEIRLITSMMSQIAVALENARLYDQSRRSAQELSALFEISTAATESLEVDHVLNQAVRRIGDTFLFDATRFFVLDEQKQTLHVRASFATCANFLHWSAAFPLGSGITGHVAANGESIIIGDTLTDQRYDELSVTKSTKEIGQRFIAGFPVKYKGEIFGVIMCMGQEPRQLTEHEIKLIDSMSGQIAVALANARLYEQSKEQAERLRIFAAHLETVREQERRRISREIHDELGQALTALKFDVSWILGKLSKNQPRLAERLSEMSTILDDTLQAIRKLATRLRPDILDKLGLIAAIEWQTEEFFKRSGIRYRFAADPIEHPLDEQQSTALFRILQESLTNVARHSGATQVNVSLRVHDGGVHLSVEDDGGGIDDLNGIDSRSLGVLGMRERAVALGGNMTVGLNEKRGTTVTAFLPLAPESQTAEGSPGRQEL